MAKKLLRVGDTVKLSTNKLTWAWRAAWIKRRRKGVILNVLVDNMDKPNVLYYRIKWDQLVTPETWVINHITRKTDV